MPEMIVCAIEPADVTYVIQGDQHDMHYIRLQAVSYFVEPPVRCKHLRASIKEFVIIGIISRHLRRPRNIANRSRANVIISVVINLGNGSVANGHNYMAQ